MGTYDEKWRSEIEWRGYGISQDKREFCETHPMRMNSHGVWEKIGYKNLGMKVWDYPLPSFEILIFSTFFLWQLFDALFTKLRVPIPKFSCMMLAGLVLSLPSYISKNSWTHEIFFPADKRSRVSQIMGAFGFSLYWFLRGVTADAGMIIKTGKRAALIGFTTMSTPIIVGSIIHEARKRSGKVAMKEDQYRTLVFLESLSAFSGVNVLLKDLKINHSEFARTAQSSAAMTDFLGVFIIFLSRLFLDNDGSVQILLAVTAIVILFYVIRPMTVWMIRQTPEGMRVKDIYIYILLTLGYFSFLYWEYFFQLPAFGLFVMGLTIPSGPPLGFALTQRFDSFNFAIFMPLFGALNMAKIDLSSLILEVKSLTSFEGLAYEATSLIVILTLVKFAVSALVAFATHMPVRDSFALALVLCNKGVLELSHLMYIAELEDFDSKFFTVSALSVLLKSLFIPIALNFLYEPVKNFVCYHDRNLSRLKANSQFRTLLCIRKPDHIISMTNFLKIFPPSEYSPMACFVLHLLELEGQSYPTFISHQMQKPKAGTRSCSDNVLNSFRQFYEDLTNGLMSVELFTSISYPKHMHEDLCRLALDKSVTMILLPFHRSWGADGSTIVSEDERMRKVTRNVLKRAPCSVGIFVFRRPIWEAQPMTSALKVCLIYVGGKDDREALAFSKRMRQTRRINLTFAHFIPKTADDTRSHGLDQTLENVDARTMMMNEAHDLRNGEEDMPVTFLEKEVVSGVETLQILQSMASDYDIFIVGKRSGMNTNVTAGLTDWTEFKELGVIGDLVASTRYSSSASVLVVQRQDLAHS